MCFDEKVWINTESNEVVCGYFLAEKNRAGKSRYGRWTVNKKEPDPSAAVKRRFCGVDLREDVLAWYVLIDHAVNSLYLPDYFFQAAVQVGRIHALFHIVS